MIKEIFFGSLGIIIVILAGFIVLIPVKDIGVCFDDCYNQADGNKTVYDECTYSCHQKMFPEDNTTLEEWMVMNHG